MVSEYTWRGASWQGVSLSPELNGAAVARNMGGGNGRIFGTGVPSPSPVHVVEHVSDGPYSIGSDTS